MEEKEYNDEIRRGFNAGYLLEKANPKLSKKLQDSIQNKKNPFMLGFAKGAEQYNQESFFESPPPEMPSNIKDLDMNKNFDTTLGKDIGGKGFEP